MGTYGAEFIDVTDPDSVDLGGIEFLRGGGRIDPLWFAAVQRRHLPTASIGGMILYLPPGRWQVAPSPTPMDGSLPPRWSADLIRSARAERDVTRLDDLDKFTQINPWNADVILDERVTLQFAPGAVLVLEDNVRMAAKGDIDADDVWIIEENGRSMFIPASKALTPLRAVWWGVGMKDDDADALERVIEAATCRRRPWRRVNVVKDSDNRLIFIDPFVVSRNRVLPSLPVLLSGEARVGRCVRGGARDPFGLEALVFERTDPAVRLTPIVQTSVILRGVANGRARPSASIRALRSFDDGRAGVGEALVSLEYARASQIEGVAFDGAGVASRCVEFVAQYPDRDMHHVQVRRCAFTGATGALLQIGPPAEGPIRESTVTLEDTHGFVGAPGSTIRITVPSVSGSYPMTFGSREGTLAAFPSTDFSGLVIESCEFDVRSGGGIAVDALVVRSAQAVPASVIDCRFRGNANAFVASVAGTVLIESCQFRNERVPAPRPLLSPETSAYDGLGTERADGADVELSVDAFDRELWERTEGGGAPLRRGDTPIASVLLFGCQSASVRLLSTPRPSPFVLQRPNRSSLVVGCSQNHRRSPATGSGPLSAIQWGIPRGVGRVGLLSLLNTATPVFSPGDPIANQALPPIAARLSSDISLCVVGTRLSGPVEVYSGATDTSLVGVRAADTPTRPYRFSQVARGILRPTVILGLCLAAALLGCASRGASTADGAVTPRDVATDVLDATFPSDSATVEDLGRDGALGDGETDAGPMDAGPADMPVAVVDSGVIRFASLGPPRQMRHNCPAVTDGDPTIPAPRLIYPMSGTRATSRRPGFRWELAAGTTGARVEVCADPCCARVITAYDAEGTTQRPVEILPPGVVWWRTRGRTAMGYGRATSFTWEVGIKRRDAPIDTAWGTIRDVNGDGYDDIATIADVRNVSRLYTILGSPSGPIHNTSDFFIHPEMGYYGSLLYGEFNADGQTDLLFTTAIYGSLDESHLLLFDGASHGFNTRRYRLFDSAIGARSSADVNGDGFQDFVSSHTAPVSADDGSLSDRARFVVYGGGALGSGGISFISDASLAAGGAQRLYNTATHTVGDQNGDGYADVIVGRLRSGRVLIFRGSASGVETIPSQVIENRFEREQSGFGAAVHAVGDLDGDQLADFAIWMMSRDQIAVYRGDRSAMSVYLGAIGVPPEDLSSRAGRTAFGSRSGPGPDLNGDGRAEVVVGCADCFWRNEYFPQGGAYVFTMGGGGEISLLGRVTIPDVGNLGSSAAGVGDVNGDGFDDLAVATEHYGNRLFLFYGREDGISETRSVSFSGPSERTTTDEHSLGQELARRRRVQSVRWM